MALSRRTSEQIVNVVAGDAECQRRITSLYGTVLGEIGLSGAFRNFSMALADAPNDGVEMAGNFLIREWDKLVGNAKSPRWQKGQIFPEHVRDPYICTGIADATVAALSAAASQIDQLGAATFASRDEGFAHAGTKVTMDDGSEYLFDWWRTLQLRDPMIFLPEAWHTCAGGVHFEDFQGFE